MTSPKKSVSYQRPVLYYLWCGMVARCHNPNHGSYPRYGGRGITVCKRWRGRGGYKRFIADMGLRPSKKHTIERIKNSDGYSPSNCKWATWEEQQRNRRNNRLLTFNGKTQCLAAWADETGIDGRVIWTRLHSGWSIKRALTAEVDSSVRNNNRNLTFNGKSQSVCAWATDLGIPCGILFGRLRRGWSVEMLLTEPHVRGKRIERSDWR